MFKSFFPNPKWFFLSLVAWGVLTSAVWYLFNDEIGALLGLSINQPEPTIGLGHFVTDSFLLFYLYYFVSTALFALFWFRLSAHRWQWWSIVGSAVILFATYFSVQVSVAINNWRRPFFDLVQKALSGENIVAGGELYALTIVFVEIAFVWMLVFVATRFLVSHFIFRWRTAMNNYYTKQWERVRHIEGASQRVQEDTMIFARIMENLGVALVDSVMTLFAFMPVLLLLSEHISELPIVGAIPYPLVIASIVWSISGTALLAIVGIKLPGIEFNNQRVEAAYRKELVYGEDHEERADPVTLKELFSNVRKNYFRMYFHYMYFNVARGLYIQADSIFVYIILVPTIAAGAITFGILQQILTAFGQVSNSFQFLVNSWTTIVELLSVHKRLAHFEEAMKNGPLPGIDQSKASPS